MNHLLHPAKQNGFSLLEVLVSLLILAIILFSLIRFQLLALQNQEASLFATIVYSQIQSIAERLYISQNHLTDLVKQWNSTNQRLLPMGKGSVQGYNPYEIKLTWLDPLTHKQTEINIKTSVY